LTAGDDYARRESSTFSYTIKEVMPMSLMGFMENIRIKHKSSEIGNGGIFTNAAMEHIRKNVKYSSKTNVIVYCDSGDRYREDDSMPKYLDCKTWICNVEYGLMSRDVKKDVMGVDNYVFGHSDLLMEYISLDNGIASVYEKGTSSSGGSHRGLY
jgi:hypothetical protein